MHVRRAWIISFLFSGQVFSAHTPPRTQKWNCQVVLMTSLQADAALRPGGQLFLESRYNDDV